MKIFLFTLLLTASTSVLLSQMPTENLIFRLDYDNDFDINSGENSYYEFQGGALTQDRFEDQNTACLFEFEKQIIKFEELPCIEQELSISLWLRYDDHAEDSNYPILLLTNGDNFEFGSSRRVGFEIQNNRTALGYYYNIGGKLVYDQSGITLNNKWMHLVGTYDQNLRMRFYLDNNFIGAKDYHVDLFEDLNQLIIGGGYSNNFGQISIDDVRIYNRTITDCEIEALYFENLQAVDCPGIYGDECGTLTNNEFVDKTKVKIYPNPNNVGWINVEGTQSKNYRILNTMGQEIKSGGIHLDKIDLSSIPPGIYFINLDQHTTKIIIE